MIDFHVHLLPGIDDGSRNIKMSLEMLKGSERQGIEISVATPHLYFDKKTEKMLEARRKAYKIILEKMDGMKYPEIKLGFEVHLSEKIFEEKDLDRLLIEGTNTMLVEMPRKRWDDEVFKRLEYIAEKGYDIVLAHPERYAPVITEQEYERLFSYGFAGQVNAASFVNPASREFAYKLIKDGRIQVMGSDAHNVGIRANFMEIACEFISRNVGEKYVEMMNENAKRFLGIK